MVLKQRAGSKPNGGQSGVPKEASPGERWRRGAVCVSADSRDLRISDFLYAVRLKEPVAGRIMAFPLFNLHFRSVPARRGWL